MARDCSYGRPAIKDLNFEGVHLGNLGSACVALGEIDKAIEYYEQSLEIVRKIEDRKERRRKFDDLGKAYVALCEVRKAIDYFEQSLEIARKIEYRRGRRRCPIQHEPGARQARPAAGGDRPCKGGTCDFRADRKPGC